MIHGLHETCSRGFGVGIQGAGLGFGGRCLGFRDTGLGIRDNGWYTKNVAGGRGEAGRLLLLLLYSRYRS